MSSLNFNQKKRAKGSSINTFSYFQAWNKQPIQSLENKKPQNGAFKNLVAGAGFEPTTFGL